MSRLRWACGRQHDVKSHTQWIAKTKLCKKISQDVCVALWLGRIHRIFNSSWHFSSFPAVSVGLSVGGRWMGAFTPTLLRKSPRYPLNSRMDQVREPVLMLRRREKFLTLAGNDSAVSRLCSATPCLRTDRVLRLGLLSSLSKNGTLLTSQYCQIAAIWHSPYSAPGRCASSCGCRCTVSRFKIWQLCVTS
jgi:hypothetical protein